MCLRKRKPEESQRDLVGCPHYHCVTLENISLKKSTDFVQVSAPKFVIFLILKYPSMIITFYNEKKIVYKI